MPSTVFQDYQEPTINAAWLNEVNNTVFGGDGALLRTSLLSSAGPGLLGAPNYSVNYAVGTIGWIDKQAAVNPCAPPWFCVADADLSTGTGAINNTGMTACLRYCESNGKALYLPGVFRMDGADGELVIRKSIQITGCGPGQGYATLLQ